MSNTAEWCHDLTQLIRLPDHAQRERSRTHLLLAALRRTRGLRRRPAPVLHQGALGEPPAPRGRREGERRRHRGPGALGRESVAPRRGRGRGRQGDRLHARTRPDAGPHRRPGRRRPRLDARRHHRPRRRPEQDQSAGPRGTGHRPLGDPRAFGHRRELRSERRHRVRTQHRALHLLEVGPEFLREVPRRASGHGHLPPGEPRAPRARRLRTRRRGVPRHAGRHRLAHDHGERSRRARLGRRRHRGRGRDARPAHVDADPAGRRSSTLGRPA